MKENNKTCLFSLSAQAHSLDEILCGRFLVGLGIGVNTVLVPIYISEVRKCVISFSTSCLTISAYSAVKSRTFLNIDFTYSQYDQLWVSILLISIFCISYV